jgi:nicotinate-nucleotide adenylyltransferase
MMEFVRRLPGNPSRLGILPGTFNPITVAHLALARAAWGWVDEVVLVLPRELPHKNYTGATFAQRLEMLGAAGTDYSVAASDGGLFADIAGECRSVYGNRVRLSFLCGRDAAERIVGWDYGREGALAEMLDEFDLLVAERDGAYHPPAEFENAIRRIDLPGEFDHVSASEVRDRIERGESWEHLVPGPVQEFVSKIYSSSPKA